MAPKRALDKLQETIVGTVRGVAKDPVGAAKGTIALGRTAAGQVAGQVTRTIRGRVGGTSPAPPPSTPGPLRTAESAPEQEAPGTPVPKPTDVARVVEKKPAAKKTPAKKAPAKKAPAKKAGAKKSTPSGKLPATKKTAEKAPPAKKTPAKKAPAEKAPAEKAPDTKPAPQKTAAEVIEDADLPSPIESIGSSTAAEPDQD